MTENTTTTTVETPKIAKAPKAKKPAKPAAKAKTSTTKSKAEIKAGPSKPQLRILAALVKAGRPISKQQVSEKSKVHMNWIAEYIGGTVNAVSNLVRGHKKLVPAGLVRIKEVDIDGVKEKLYEVTAMGKKAVK
jgi:hypothetical protein